MESITTPIILNVNFAIFARTFFCMNCMCCVALYSICVCHDVNWCTRKQIGVQGLAVGKGQRHKVSIEAAEAARVVISNVCVVCVSHVFDVNCN